MWLGCVGVHGEVQHRCVWSVYLCVSWLGWVGYAMQDGAISAPPVSLIRTAIFLLGYCLIVLGCCCMDTPYLTFCVCIRLLVRFSSRS
ncbi:hypothetical protein F5Y07DRAFT_349321 [Xylaria sp. FL0933]|nr:hypothetical protein F5Y07DRAFT_349321 [Xylaria sp. FL0933]